MISDSILGRALWAWREGSE